MSNEFKWEFLIETEELLNEVEGDIIDLEYSSKREVVNRVFRAFHTIKGNAAILEYERTSRLADYATILVGMIRSDELEPTNELVNTLLNVKDYILMLLNDIRVGRDICSCDIGPLCSKLRGYEEGSDGKGAFLREKLRKSWEQKKNRRLRTLIVEDDFVSRKILGKLLSQFGEVDVAVNGKEAVDIFSRTISGDYDWSYDLICMDIMMPGISGLEAAKKIRTIEHELDVELSDEVVIIMVTAVNDPSTVIKSLYKCGANSYLVKPIERDDLYRELANSNLINKIPLE